MSLKFREIEVFWAVYRSESVSEAAKLLNVSQPAISMMLKSAEERFGVRLFERSGGRLRPTIAARALFPTADKICVEMREMESEVTRVRTQGAEELRIAAARPLEAGYVRPCLQEFRRQNPETYVTVLTVGTKEVLDLAAKGAIDFGIAYGLADRGDVPAMPLCTAEIVCVFRRDHPFAKHSVITLDHLKKERVMTYRFDSPFGEAIEKTLAEAGVEMDFYLQSTAQATACLAEQGFGVALVDPIVLDGNAFHSLTLRPFRPSVRMAVEIVMPPARPMSGIASDFIDRIRNVPRHTDPVTRPSVSGATADRELIASG